MGEELNGAKPDSVIIDEASVAPIADAALGITPEQAKELAMGAVAYAAQQARAEAEQHTPTLEYRKATNGTPPGVVPPNYPALGHHVPVPTEPSRLTLEVFQNPTKGAYSVTFGTGEITSCCPVTGQPDFGSIQIAYQPNEVCIESKSLKLYLQSYRNQQTFWEHMINRIADDLYAVLQPARLSVVGEMNPRGGVAMKVVATR